MRNRKKQNKAQGHGHVRLIAGDWRGRKIPVLNSQGLRPTTDRTRETVFNWLMPYLAGSVCLDAYAGTGILGLECLSRGAKVVDFVEQDRSIAAALKSNLLNLGGNGVVYWASIEKFIASLPSNSQRYGIIFVDPPFSLGIQESICQQLIESGCLSESALIYVESDIKHDFTLPSPWNVFREKHSGKVKYQLWRR